MLRNNADARRCSYFELGLPVVFPVFFCVVCIDKVFLVFLSSGVSALLQASHSAPLPILRVLHESMPGS